MGTDLRRPVLSRVGLQRVASPHVIPVEWGSLWVRAEQRLWSRTDLCLNMALLVDGYPQIVWGNITQLVRWLRCFMREQVESPLSIHLFNKCFLLCAVPASASMQ